MFAVRLAAALCLACLTACAPATPDASTAAALPTEALPVAPSLSALAPGSPLARVPGSTPSPTNEPAEQTSPLPKAVPGWTAYQTTESNGIATVNYAKASRPDEVITAGLFPANKSQAQIEDGMPGGVRHGKVWCAPSPTNARASSCVLKVDANSAVLAIGSEGLRAADVATVTQALVDNL